MTFVSLGEAVERALSAGYFGAAGTALEREKATATAGTEAVVSFHEVRNSATGPVAKKVSALDTVTMPTMDMDGRVATHDRLPRLATRQPMLRVIEGGRRAGGGGRSPSVQRSPREGKARRTVLKLVVDNGHAALANNGRATGAAAGKSSGAS